MAEFAPPTGPPPPKVPEGWKAVWNAQYSEWFFVNIYTKQSQWDKPTEPVYPPGEGPPHGPPPGYAPPASGGVSSYPTGTSDKSGFGSNNPYAGAGANISEDEKLARRLQEEEEARAGGPAGEHRAAANDYYNQPVQSQSGQYGGYPQQSASPYPQQTQTPYQDTTTQDRGKSKGLLGKLLGKASGHGSSSTHSYPPQQHGYGQPAPGGYYGGGYQQPPMGYGMPAGGRRPGGGMGAGGAMALGAGGGLLGGALLGSAMADAGDGGGDYGGDGGDYGGGDGGGDFGGDGGGDFGGGGDF
ncbi:Nn.00g078380.m01.CDS01 [Neocucurbitaria sp. VM-36]